MVLGKKIYSIKWFITSAMIKVKKATLTFLPQSFIIQFQLGCLNDLDTGIDK